MFLWIIYLSFGSLLILVIVSLLLVDSPQRFVEIVEIGLVDSFYYSFSFVILLFIVILAN